MNKSRLAIRVFNFLVHHINAKRLNDVMRFETVVILKWVLSKCFAAVYREDCGKVHSWLQWLIGWFMEMNTQTLLWLIYSFCQLMLIDLCTCRPCSCYSTEPARNFSCLCQPPGPHSIGGGASKVSWVGCR